MAEAADKRVIPFSPPDITEAEIEEVAEALRSGWITTGPRTKELEKRLKAYTQADGFACFASATHAAEMCLRILGIGPGDEVIVPAYTYTASASVVCHVGAKLVLVDTLPGSYEPDYDAIANAITERTKVVVPVDIAGRMVDYDRLFAALESKRSLWRPANDWQRCFDRVIVLADAAHALGATYHGAPAGSVADFTSFSFHAVKNFTTAEGGGLAWRKGIDSAEFYHQCMLWSLHGQSKDALAKTKIGAWEYDIEFPGYKSNMTDVAAALGLVQLDRYPDMLARRHEMVARYQRNLADAPIEVMQHDTSDRTSSCHLMLTRVPDALPVLRGDVPRARRPPLPPVRAGPHEVHRGACEEARHQVQRGEKTVKKRISGRTLDNHGGNRILHQPRAPRARPGPVPGRDGRQEVRVGRPRDPPVPRRARDHAGVPLRAGDHDRRGLRGDGALHRIRPGHPVRGGQHIFSPVVETGPQGGDYVRRKREDQ